MSKIAVVYWSGTGNTEKMADQVVAGVKSGGAEVAPPAPCREHPASRAAARRTGAPDLQMLRIAYPSSGSVTGT